MKRVFQAAVVACLVLAGWALWTGGILDGAIARQVRSSNFYAAPEVQIDRPAAERIIGNRRLVVVIMAPDADLRDGCDAVRRAADGTLVLLLSQSGDGYESYGCSLLPGAGDENFGRAFVAETVVSRGVDEFPDRPLDAIKVAVVNFDQLARSDTVPREARTISPSLPRYLTAAAAVLAVVLGSLAAWLLGRRVAGAAAGRVAARTAADDAHAGVSAAASALAQRVIELDRVAAVSPGEGLEKRYREWAAECAELLGSLDGPPETVTKRLQRLAEKSDRLLT